ncbi:MAG: hypothetical protein LBT46_02305 [Planctomycetaceae bacterium]|jgi:hypothetical protein|nr:hypothetical protein [Planctomycetaceae bacterium]
MSELSVAEIEAVLHQLLPGLQMFVRDVNLPEYIAAKYETGLIIREKGFTDATSRIGGMPTTHRFGIMSNHLADFSELDVLGNRGLSVAPAGSHFLVMKQHVYHNRTLILLLHLPDDETWQLCQHFTGSLIEELVNTSIANFEAKCELEPISELANDEWLHRCQSPLGIDENSNLFEIDPQGIYRWYEGVENIDELPDVMQEAVKLQISVVKLQAAQWEKARQDNTPSVPKIDENIPLEKIHGWITALDIQVELPQDKQTAWKVLRSLQKEHPPSDKQLAFLQSLGYDGEPPKTMFDAVCLIESLKDTSKKHHKPSLDEMAGKPPTEKQLEYLDKLGIDVISDAGLVGDRANASRLIAALEDGADPDNLASYFRFGRKKGQWFEQEEDRDKPGTVRHTFSAGELNKIRNDIHKGLAKVEKNLSFAGVDNWDGNWSAYSGNWEPLYQSLKHLKIKNGYTLGAYIIASHGNSNGIVFGVAIDTDISDIEIVRTDYSKKRMRVPPFVFGPIHGNPNDPWGCPKLPKNSVPSYMSLFIGDNTPESYLESAILFHELSDFGARWHGVDWGDVDIQCPDDYHNEEECRGEKYARFDCFIRPELVKPFANPTVIMHKNKVIVRFLAFCGHTPNRFYFARHIFKRTKANTMDLQYDEDVIAIGNDGFIH